MSKYIHARRRKGGIVYRVWNSFNGLYETPPVSEEALHPHVLNSQLLKAIDDYLFLPARIAQAQKSGTSQADVDPHPSSLKEKWERQEKPDDTPPPPWFAQRLELLSYLERAVEAFAQDQRKKDKRWSWQKFSKKAATPPPFSS